MVETAVNPPASVVIGSRTWISRDAHIASRRAVRIGSDVLVGEFVSIRDTTHDWREAEVPIRLTADIVGEVTIEDNVWIGRGSLILGRPEGVTIGIGAVVAANSVVSSSVQPGTLVGGAPARVIGSRSNSHVRKPLAEQQSSSAIHNDGPFGASYE